MHDTKENRPDKMLTPPLAASIGLMEGATVPSPAVGVTVGLKVGTSVNPSPRSRNENDGLAVGAPVNDGDGAAVGEEVPNKDPGVHP